MKTASMSIFILEIASKILLVCLAIPLPLFLITISLESFNSNSSNHSIVPSEDPSSAIISVEFAEVDFVTSQSDTNLFRYSSRFTVVTPVTKEFAPTLHDGQCHARLLVLKLHERETGRKVFKIPSKSLREL